MRPVVLFDPQPLRTVGFERMLEGSEFKLVNTSGVLDASAVFADGTVVVISDSFAEDQLMQFLSGLGPQIRRLVLADPMDAQRLQKLALRGRVSCVGSFSSDRSQLLQLLDVAAGDQVSLMKLDLEPIPGQNVRLTPREEQIVELVAQGLKNKEIAEVLTITAGTVKVHLMHIFEKVGCKDRGELASWHLRRKARNWPNGQSVETSS